nr:hypothetical protein MFLOJ_48210 [Mycobacterium florentinum]
MGVRYVKPSRAAMLTTNSSGAAELIRLASRRAMGAAGTARLVSTRLTLATTADAGVSSVVTTVAHIAADFADDPQFGGA